MEDQVKGSRFVLVVVSCVFLASPAWAQAGRGTRNDFLKICATDDADPKVIGEFLDRGVDIDVMDRRGNTALVLCAKRGDVDSCLFLLERGADVDAEDSVGKSALAYARVLGLPDLEKALLEAGARESIATIIVREGTTVLDVMRMRPIPTAACAACIEAIHDAGLEMSDLDGEQVLCSVARNCPDPKALDMVIKAGVEPTDAVLFCASMNPTPKVMESLLGRGLDVNVRDERLTTPFFRAASFNPNPEILRLLMEAGADVGIKDDDGDTPLHQAATMNINGPVIVSFLLETGAGPDVRNNRGETPLFVACEYSRKGKSVQIIKQLIEAGADVNTRSSVDADGIGGLTPILAAVTGTGKDPASMRMLIESGADLDARATGKALGLKKGQNCIYPAIIARNRDILPLLIESGVDVNIRDDDGLTPLDVALGYGEWIETPWAAELLVAAGAQKGTIGDETSRD